MVAVVAPRDPALLICDELGYLALDQHNSNLLYQVISARHAAKRSTVITTNLAFKQAGNTFPRAACVVALVDRTAQHCHSLEILGESYHDKHRLDLDRPKPSTCKSRRKRA